MFITLFVKQYLSMIVHSGKYLYILAHWNYLVVKNSHGFEKKNINIYLNTYYIHNSVYILSCPHKFVHIIHMCTFFNNVMKVIRYTSYTRIFILSRELHKLPHTYKRLLSRYYKKKMGCVVIVSLIIISTKTESCNVHIIGTRGTYVYRDNNIYIYRCLQIGIVPRAAFRHFEPQYKKNWRPLSPSEKKLVPQKNMGDRFSLTF